MSRNIPNAKTWRVAYYHGKFLIGYAHVNTITKFLAKMIAAERTGYLAAYSTRVTCGRIANKRTEAVWRDESAIALLKVHNPTKGLGE